MPVRARSSAGHEGTWIALLRGVNVGGKGRVPMAELRELFTSLGFENVRTLIQSGNVIFTAESAPSERALEEAIAERFEVNSAVVVRSAVELARVADRRPFGEVDLAQVHVGFLAEALSKESIAALDVERFAPERIAAAGSEIFFLLPGGMGNSKLASYVSRKLGGLLTVRNWNTVTTLAELAAN